MNPRPRRSFGPGRVYVGGTTGRGRFWLMVYTELDGARRRVRWYGTQRGARLEMARRVTERDAILRGRGVEYTPKMPFGELAKRYIADMAERVSPGHLESTKKALERMGEGMALRNVEDVTMEALVAYRKGRLSRDRRPSNRTVNLEVGALRQVMNWAVRRNLISSSPLAGYQQLPQGRGHKATKRALTESELGRLIRAFRTLDARQPEKYPSELVFLGLLTTGARYGELRQLTRACWSPLDSILTIADATTKTGQGRDLKADAPMGGGLHGVVNRSLEASARISGVLPSPDSPIWGWGDGGSLPIETRSLNKRLLRAMALAEIPRKTAQGSFSVHAIRHTMVSRCARFGVAPERTQYWVGHSSASMTQDVYTHIQAADLQLARTGIVPEFSASNLPPTAIRNEAQEGA